MRARNLHPWRLTPRAAIEIQERLRGRVRAEPLALDRIGSVAGCDCALAGSSIVASVVVLSLPGFEVVDAADARAEACFPYVPGLLSFREVPAILRAFEKISRRPGALLCDGQGLAHPRRFGLACHLGLLLDLPAAGVAKSLLVGEPARSPGERRGSSVPLLDGGETIGRVLRTRDRVRPVYVSIGHRITLADAVALVLRCGGGLPASRAHATGRPSRRAHEGGGFG